MDPEGQYIKTDPHDPRNWCRICGSYYCWHTEAIKTPAQRQQYGHHESKHKFKPAGKYRHHKGYWLNFSRFWVIRIWQKLWDKLRGINRLEKYNEDYVEGERT